MPSTRPATLAILALILMTSIWGYNWVVMKQVLQYADPFDFSAIRTLLGAATLFIVLTVLRRPMRIQAVPWVALLGLLQTAAFTALVQWALVTGGAGKTACWSTPCRSGCCQWPGGFWASGCAAHNGWPSVSQVPASCWC